MLFQQPSLKEGKHASDESNAIEIKDYSEYPDTDRTDRTVEVITVTE